MEENAVGSAPVAEQVVAPADAGQANEISISDLMAEKPKTEAVAQKPQPEVAKGFYKSQAEVDAAFGERSKKIKRDISSQYESSPEYQLGRMLVEERAAKDGVSKEEAAKRIAEDQRKAQAAYFAEKPDEGFDFLLRQRNKTDIQKPELEEVAEPEQVDDKAIQAKLKTGVMDEQTATMTAAFVRQAVESGALPEDFDPTTDMRQLIRNWSKFGFEAAADFLIQSRATGAGADPIAQRRAEPQPIRATGESTQGGPVDLRGKSSAEVLEIWKKGKQATASGKRVKLT